MHMIRHMGNKRKIFGNIIILMTFLLAGVMSSCGKKEALTDEQIAEKLKKMDELFLKESAPVYATRSFYLAELEQQIEGYWDYYKTYQESLQDVEQIVLEWETDFLADGVYDVGEDIPTGFYVFCDPNKDDNDEKNAYGTLFMEKKIYWDSPHFAILRFDAGDRLWVRGAPKFAHIDQFPAFTAAEDGNYYDQFYRIGTDIPEGRYMMLTMDIEKGDLSFYTNIQSYGSGTDSHWNISARSRFIYVDLRLEDEYIKMSECVLIPVDQSPKVMPIEHINMTSAGKITWLETLGIEKEWRYRVDDYKQPVYVEGDYIIGEDIPLGTYQIHEEVTAGGGYSYNEDCHPQVMWRLNRDKALLWSGVTLPNENEAMECGWKSVRVKGTLVEVMGAEENAEYLELEKENTFTVTFGEKERGCVVRVTRAILVQEEDFVE